MDIGGENIELMTIENEKEKIEKGLKIRFKQETTEK